MEIPKNIRNLIGDKFGKSVSIGMSGASVYLFDDMVLKIQEQSRESDIECKMLKWLSGKVPVPIIIEHTLANKLSYLLMSKCDGEIACSEALTNEPKMLVNLLADAMELLWSVDISDCPSDYRLQNKLQQAEYNVINRLVDPQGCEPETFGKYGFKTPEELLCWLKNNAPDEEPVLSHGDFCLPNIFIKNGTLSGFIDLGRSGIADKWCDIAICHRSLLYNYNGSYSGKPFFGYKESYLFDALQIKPDWEKIRYYRLLDELF